MKNHKSVVTAGFAMFSMFFGSGNLVFPLAIGTETTSNATFATLGLLLTGVVVPFLGLIGIILYEGSRHRFFESIGKTPAFLLTFIMLALLGPFGVIPRCIIVAYGGVQAFMPSLSLEAFSLGFCLLTLYFVWNHDRVVPIIGKILTPWLIIGVFTIIIAGFILGPETPPSRHSVPEAFSIGLFEGYQTMDLLAAFFFSVTTVAYLRKYLAKNECYKDLAKSSLNACFIGAGLLSVVYIGFVLLGAKFAPSLQNVFPHQMLASIAGHTLGSAAIPVVSITIALACLTTATILTMLFSDFLHEDILKERFNPHVPIIITLALSFFISKVGFASLRTFLGSILEVAYPALIAFTLSSIIQRYVKPNFNHIVFWIVIACSAAYKFIF